MEDSSPLILEISSDEEAGFGDCRKGSGEFCDGEDGNWLSKLLDEVGRNIDDDDSDDVVVVSEVFPKTPKKSRSASLKPLVKVVGDQSGDDDDDCVVLDGDPDKAMVVANTRVDDDDDDSEDLKIVGEKGEVACRDFPHPRHLCAKFLFASTAHDLHCSQCHCYVCDSLAPCSYWGTGSSIIDHCHANDKEQYWRTERELVKKVDKSVPVISTAGGTYPLETYFPTTQAPAITRSQPNSLMQGPGFNPVTICPRALSSNVSLPNAVNQVQIHPSGYALPRYRPSSQLASLQLHPTSNNNVASRDKTHHVGSRSPQSFTPRAVFKRHGFAGAPPNNGHAYWSQLSGDPSLRRCGAFQTPVVSRRHSSNQQNVASHTPDTFIPQPKFSSPHNINVRCANYLPSQPLMNSQLYSSFVGQDPMQLQPQTPGQPYVNRNFPGAGALQPNMSSQPSAENTNNLVLPQPHVFQQNNPVLSQTVASYESDAGNAFGNQLHSRSIISSHPNAGNNLENHPYQAQKHDNPTSILIDGQNDDKRGNHAQNGISTSPVDFSFYLDSSNQQIHAEESQYQSTSPAGSSQLQIVPTVDNFSQQSSVVADYSSPINDADCQFPQSTGPDFQFDSWKIENQSLSGAAEVSVSPIWNIFSPEPAFVESGTLFDI